MEKYRWVLPLIVLAALAVPAPAQTFVPRRLVFQDPCCPQAAAPAPLFPLVDRMVPLVQRHDARPLRSILEHRQPITPVRTAVRRALQITREKLDKLCERSAHAPTATPSPDPVPMAPLVQEDFVEAALVEVTVELEKLDATLAAQEAQVQAAAGVPTLAPPLIVPQP